MSVDVHFSAQKQVKIKNQKGGVIMSADVHFPAQKQVETKKKGHHVRKCPFFCPKIIEDQKKTSSCPQMSIFLPKNK